MTKSYCCVTFWTALYRLSTGGQESTSKPPSVHGVSVCVYYSKFKDYIPVSM